VDELGTVISCPGTDHPVVVELDGTAAVRCLLYWSDFTTKGLTPTLGLRVKVRGDMPLTQRYLCGAAE
jgi:hypothetical protein